MDRKIGKKLETYFKETGVQKIWFAARLGISSSMIWQIMSGNSTLPHKYWQKAIEHSRGYVTIEDLMNDHIFFILRKNPYARVKQNRAGDSWTINIKSFSKRKSD